MFISMHTWTILRDHQAVFTAETLSSNYGNWPTESCAMRRCNQLVPLITGLQLYTYIYIYIHIYTYTYIFICGFKYPSIYLNLFCSISTDPSWHVRRYEPLKMLWKRSEHRPGEILPSGLAQRADVVQYPVPPLFGAQNTQNMAHNQHSEPAGEDKCLNMDQVLCWIVLIGIL